MDTLYVLYKSNKRFPANSLILSFLSPEDEYRFPSSYSKLLFGRKEMDAVREKARKVYINLIASIAATPHNDKTLRQALHMPDKGNPWWYHKMSEKDSEADETFNMLLHVFTIIHIAEREHTEKIILYRAPVEIVKVLSSRYKTKGIRPHRKFKTNPIIGVLSRLKYLYRTLHFHYVIRNNFVLSGLKPDIVLQGFFGGSVEIDKEKGIRDNYFKALPGYLMDKGIKCAWFLFFDFYHKYGYRKRTLNQVIKLAIGNYQLVFVQRFLKLRDIVSSIFDFRPLYKYLQYSRQSEFKGLFKREGINFWPLLKSNLLYNFSNHTIPHYFLMETACRRAFVFYRPKLAFSFLDLFLSSRAFYLGARLGNPATLICDMQHASYGREKTFILMEPNRELRGEPDNIPMPVPDYFFVMGELCKDILIENGFKSEKIFITGSARYDHIETSNGRLRKKRDSFIAKVLLTPTLNLGLDFEMIQAAFLAVKDLNVKLYLRSHPIARMEDMPEFKRYSKYIISVTDSLVKELTEFDLVLFTYSTLAEEALLKGVPILQWQSAGFNGSVFRDIRGIPSVSSVEDLREAFKLFLLDLSYLRPTAELQGLVLRKCFHKADAQSASRIAEKTIKILSFA